MVYGRTANMGLGPGAGALWSWTCCGHCRSRTLRSLFFLWLLHERFELFCVRFLPLLHRFDFDSLHAAEPTCTNRFVAPFEILFHASHLCLRDDLVCEDHFLCKRIQNSDEAHEHERPSQNVTLHDLSPVRPSLIACVEASAFLNLDFLLIVYRRFSSA